MKRRGAHYLTPITVGLNAEQLEQFYKVKDHLGLLTNASVLRTLVIQRARILERREQKKEEQE